MSMALTLGQHFVPVFAFVGIPTMFWDRERQIPKNSSSCPKR